jgi:hypothetical protein
MTEVPMKKKLHFHEDASHGWLAVKVKEIVDLGIEKEISGYSYMNGQTVYLEEDLDAGIYLNAMKEKHGDIEFEFKRSYRETSPIRNYKYYRS